MDGRRLTLAIVFALALAGSQALGQFLQPPPVSTDGILAVPSEALENGELDEEEEDEIETDRDSFTPATTTAGYRRLIVESAWSFIDNRRVPDTNSLPELVTRYGVNDWLELRLGWNWEAGGAPNNVSSGGSDPEEP